MSGEPEWAQLQSLLLGLTSRLAYSRCDLGAALVVGQAANMGNEISDWLEQLGLGKYAEAFAENDIDFDVVSELTDEDLRQLGLSLGHRRKFLKAVAEFDDAVDRRASGDAADTLQPSLPQAEAERRQLTVMFCDLVGSTEISNRLDPEDVRELMHRYQNTVAGVVARFEGHVAKLLGDGVLAFFGWPRAYEDQAERAVRCGLAAVEAVADLKTKDGQPLKARVGIATGQVVIGDLVGEVAVEADAVAGKTPNLAARLEGVAAPGQVVIGSDTRRLVGHQFSLNSLGRQELKGFEQPVPAWLVVSEASTDSRFAAAHPDALSRLVGRQSELGVLLDRWELAKRGEGQVVLVSGEAGIGKSRIVEALRESAINEPHTRLRFQCSPYHTSTALYPFINQLERAAEFVSDDTPKAKLDKLEALLSHSTEQVDAVAPLFAALLSVATGERYQRLEMTSEQQKERTLEALTDQLLGLAARQPVLFIFEDAHWVDPTSLEALERMIDLVEGVPVLAVITYRPTFTPPWHGYTHVTSLTLNRLGREQCAAIVEHVTDGKALPGEVLDEILVKTDGIPLFVEELTKTVLETGLLVETDDGYRLTEPLSSLAIPSTLRDSLMARLDRLAPAKEVAQIGAAIGREFSHQLLAAVSPLSDSELDEAVANLVESELVFRRYGSTGTRYIFKHALVQDTAYGTMLKGRRQELHRRIARALETIFPETKETEPELLAHHLTEAGLMEPAIDYWLRAGRRAGERSAHLEAVAHCIKGIGLVEKLSETDKLARHELDLCLTLGTSLISAKGYATPELGQVYGRARKLCEQLGDTERLFPVIFGQWLSRQQTGQHAAAKTLAEEALTLAQTQSEPAFLLQGHHATWTTLFGYSDLPSCLHHAEQGTIIYDIDKHRSHAFLYGGHDPGVCGWNHMAVSQWFLGYPDEAIEAARKGTALAKQLSHPFSQVLSLAFSSFLHHYRRDPVATRESAEAAITLCEVQGIAPNYAVIAHILRGWSVAAIGEQNGLAEITQGVADWRATGANLRLSYLLGVMAEACGWAGQPAEGLKAVSEALAAIETSGERKWEPELHRLKGELLLSVSPGNQSEAEDCFKQAIQPARALSAKSLELRAVTGLARLWFAQGRAEEARDMLAHLYDWFTEGFDTPDLKDAKALLNELA